MKAVKAIYENGKIKLSEKPAEKGPVEVMVVFPETDPWDAILNERFISVLALRRQDQLRID